MVDRGTIGESAFDLAPDDRAKHCRHHGEDHHLRHACFEPADASAEAAPLADIIHGCIEQLLQLALQYADGAEDLPVRRLAHGLSAWWMRRL